MRIAVRVLLVVHVLLFVFVIGSRLFFPYELEWMTGSILDHVERARMSQPIYVEPSGDWIPFLYPPLYYSVTALLGGSFLSCRLLSLTAAAAQALLIWRLAGKLGADRFWRLVAAGLFVACFSFSGWWYDLERADTLFVAMMLGAAALLVEERLTAVAGLLVGIGFFVKQPAMFFLAGGTLGLLSAREWRRAALFFVPAAGAVLAGALLLGSRAGYYVFDVPRAHGLMPRLFGDVLEHDVALGFVMLAATALFVREHRVFAGMLLGGLAAALSGRLHIGGWINVLQPWTSFACVAVSVVGMRWPRAAPPLVLVQLALLLYDPRTRIPGKPEATRALLDRVEALPGEVLLVGRGHVTWPRHFHMAALADVAHAQGRAPEAVLGALRTQRYGAIVDDARPRGEGSPRAWAAVMLEDIPAVREALLSRYFIGEKLPEAPLAMRAPAQPRYVYFPRKAPLPESDPSLKARQAAEMDLVASGVPTAEIETRARSLVP